MAANSYKLSPRDFKDNFGNIVRVCCKKVRGEGNKLFHLLPLCQGLLSPRLASNLHPGS